VHARTYGKYGFHLRDFHKTQMAEKYYKAIFVLRIVSKSDEEFRKIRHHFLYAFKCYIAFITSLSAKLINAEVHRVKIRHTEYNLIPPRHLEITDRNFFKPPK